jgi:hypothetical protein
MSSRIPLNLPPTTLKLAKSSKPEPDTAPPPLPKSAAAVRAALSEAKRTHHRDRLFRVLTAAGILLSVVLALWSLFSIWFPLQTRLGDLTTQASRLSSENDALSSKWSPEKVARLRADYATVHSSLFVSPAAFNSWLANLRSDCQDLKLGFKVSLEGPSAMTNAPDFALIPARISLDFSRPDAADDSPYQRLMKLNQAFTAQGKRADLTQMRVEGGPNSVKHADLVFQLWASDQPNPNP